MKNSSEIFNHGYVAGYNQCKVDNGLMTQDEADEILRTGFGSEKTTENLYIKCIACGTPELFSVADGSMCRRCNNELNGYPTEQ